MADKTATVIELARLWGVTRQAVAGLARQGVIARHGRNFLREDSTQRYCAHLRKLATGRGGESAIASATSERARLTKAQADAVELKNATLRGDMLPAADVEAEWSSILRSVRASMLAVPSRCASRLPHLTKHDTAEIDREVRAALTELGGGRGPQLEDRKYWNPK
jgi:phage terminase Nu1 subunit (DNA packaging protein)